MTDTREEDRDRDRDSSIDTNVHPTNSRLRDRNPMTLAAVFDTTQASAALNELTASIAATCPIATNFAVRPRTPARTARCHPLIPSLDCETNKGG